MLTKGKKEEKVLLETVVKDIKIHIDTLQDNIKRQKIKDATLEDGIPSGLYKALKNQTKKYGGIENLILYDQAAIMLRMQKREFDRMVNIGVDMDPIPLEKDSFLQYFFRKGRLRFRDKVFFKYEIPAEYSTDNKAFHIGSRLVRKDAVKELSNILEIKQEQQMYVRSSITRRKHFPIIFYDSDLGVAIYIEEREGALKSTTNIHQADVEDRKKSEFSEMGIYPKRKIINCNSGKTHYHMTFLQVSSPPHFNKFFGIYPIVTSYPPDEKDFISRLTQQFYYENTSHTNNQKLDWFDGMVAIYREYKTRLYK